MEISINNQSTTVSRHVNAVIDGVRYVVDTRENDGNITYASANVALPEQSVTDTGQSYTAYISQGIITFDGVSITAARSLSGYVAAFTQLLDELAQQKGGAA